MMRAVWLAFWGELNTPSAYQDDPYGALANQSGHLALGAFLAAALSLAYCGIFGEMPFRWPVWASVVTTYLVAVEWLKQGWSGADSVIDSAFVALGAAAARVSKGGRIYPARGSGTAAARRSDPACRDCCRFGGACLPARRSTAAGAVTCGIRQPFSIGGVCK